MTTAIIPNLTASPQLPAEQFPDRPSSTTWRAASDWNQPILPTLPSYEITYDGIAYLVAAGKLDDSQAGVACFGERDNPDYRASVEDQPC